MDEQNPAVSNNIVSQSQIVSQFQDEATSFQMSKKSLAPAALLETSQKIDEKSEVIEDDRSNIKPSDKSILIIEDDHNFSNILIELAQEKGFKYLIAKDGETGLQLAQEYHPQAVILDVGLPQLDGISVMERLKDNPNTRAIPVHFISASDQSSEAKKMGAIGYLIKPVSVDEKEMEVLVADNGKEALKKLEKEPNIDIVLMDIMMPEMDGYKAIQEIRTQPRFRQLPIIALTAKAMKGDKAKCIEAGANDYLAKPMDTDKLFSLMRVWFYR